MATLDHQILVVVRFSFTCAIQCGMRNAMKIKYMSMFLQTISVCNGLSLNCCTLVHRFVVVLWFGTDRFYPFPSGLFHRDWGNHMIYHSLGPCSLKNFKAIWQLRWTLWTHDWNLGWVYGLGCRTIIYFNNQQHSPILYKTRRGHMITQDATNRSLELCQNIKSQSVTKSGLLGGLRWCLLFSRLLINIGVRLCHHR